MRLPRPPAYDLPHRWIDGKPFRVVGILVTRHAAVHGLPQQGRHRVPHVLPRPPVVEQTSRRRGQAQHIIEFAIGQEPRVAGHLGAVELKLQAAVKADPQDVLCAFTHWILRTSVSRLAKKPVFLRPNAAS